MGDAPQPDPTDDALAATYGAPLRYDVLTLDQLAKIPPLTETIEGRVTDGCSVTIAGPPGSAKTFLAVDLAARLGLGYDWGGGQNVSTPQRVLYVPGEGVRGLFRRIRAWELWHSSDLGDQLHVVDLHGSSLWRPEDYGGRVRMDDLFVTIETGRYGVVIMDTLSSLFVGADDNSSKDVPQIAAAVNRVRDIAGHAFLLHHTGKDADRGGRGHSSLRANTDETWIVDRTGTQVTCHTYGDKQGKRKDGPEWRAQWTTLGDPALGSLVLSYDTPGGGGDGVRAAQDELIDRLCIHSEDVFGQPESQRAFERAGLGVAAHRVREALEAARVAGLMLRQVVPGRGPYALWGTPTVFPTPTEAGASDAP